MKFTYIIMLLTLISINFILAEEFGYNYLEQGENLNPSVNYSTVNVNNSQYLRGYTPDDLISNINDGTAQGQMAFWNTTLGKWVNTETSELFWDDVNKRLGLGTNSPQEPITLYQSDDDGGIKIYGYDDVSNRYMSILLDHYGVVRFRSNYKIDFRTDDTLAFQAASGNRDYEVTARDWTFNEWANVNGRFMHYGVIGGGTTRKYVYWKVDDSTDSYNLVRQDNNITGFNIDMPTSFGSNSLGGLSNGDINVSTVYYDALQAKSPLFQCSEDWCQIGFPKYQKTLWIQKDDMWNILDIVYEGVHYTKQEFNQQVCQSNPTTLNICQRLNQKILKLHDKAICEYQWDGECFENVAYPSTYILAVRNYEENMTYQQDYSCYELNDFLVPILSTCYYDVFNGTRTIYEFNEGCGWNEQDGYYCEVRELR